jgi:hypothetical protein
MMYVDTPSLYCDHHAHTTNTAVTANADHAYGPATSALVSGELICATSHPKEPHAKLNGTFKSRLEPGNVSVVSHAPNDNPPSIDKTDRIVTVYPVINPNPL